MKIGLPIDFVAAWDTWAQQMLARTQQMLAETWETKWTLAPVWRFVMPAGACGAGAAAGVMLPSVDRVGRYFPLAIAVIKPGLGSLRAPDICERLEHAGRETLEAELSPDELVVRLDAAMGPCSPDGREDPACGWWTEGAPGFAPVFWEIAGLPDIELCVRLLVESEAGS